MKKLTKRQINTLQYCDDWQEPRGFVEEFVTIPSLEREGLIERRNIDLGDLFWKMYKTTHKGRMALQRHYTKEYGNGYYA